MSALGVRRVTCCMEWVKDEGIRFREVARWTDKQGEKVSHDAPGIACSCKG